MSMGIGYGLSEKLMFDPKTGRALNNNRWTTSSPPLWITPV